MTKSRIRWLVVSHYVWTAVVVGIAAVAASNAWKIHSEPFRYATAIPSGDGVRFDLSHQEWMLGRACFDVLLYLFLAAMNVLAARRILRVADRTIPYVVAGMNLMVFPLGSALGFWTFRTLVRNKTQTPNQSLQPTALLGRG
jgi:hypothetical protein